jgi:ADP-heptose:LPS heptosyltransferase
MSDLPPTPWIGPGPAQGPFAPPRPSMQGRYLLRSPRAALAMTWLDCALSLVPVRRPAVPERLERILLANLGHLGDVVTTFGAIEALRRRHPGVEIGMIVASGGRAAIADTGLVDRIHLVDHWMVNRSALSARDKRRRYRTTRAQALREIRAARYQAGIDLYPFFPPAHPLFYRAGIPVRVGFTSGGFGPLLTHPVRWPDARLPIAEHYRLLLEALDPTTPVPTGAMRPRRDRATLAPLPPALAGLSPYVVLHPGAGAGFKEWGMTNWCALARRLLEIAPDRRIVVTGAGAGESAMAAEIAALSPAIIDLSGKADWQTFVSIVAHAEMIVCPDTAAGHVAAAVDVPVVSIFTGTNIAEQWQPYTPRNRLLVQPLVCAPCNRPGCAVMACIRPIEPAQVLAAMDDLGWRGG